MIERDAKTLDLVSLDIRSGDSVYDELVIQVQKRREPLSWLRWERMQGIQFNRHKDLRWTADRSVRGAEGYRTERVQDCVAHRVYAMLRYPTNRVPFDIEKKEEKETDTYNSYTFLTTDSLQFVSWRLSK